jgi:hypothetical protein
MGGESPNVILFDVNGEAMGVQNSTAIPTGTSALIFGGSDGTNAHYTLMDSSGRIVIVGAGTAGTPVGGVVSVQGVSGGTSLPIAISDVTNTGALGSLNATISVTHPGLQSIGMQLAAGTLVGTIVPEISYDGGTTWNQTFFDNPTTGNITTAVSFASSNTATALTIVGVGGSGMTRVRVSAYTSGTANVTVRASDINDPPVLSSGAAGSALPPVIQQVGGSVTTSVPTYTTGTFNALSLNTSGGLRVDGSAVTQPVSGTVTANQGTANTIANSWTTEITDGTHGPAAVKAASTAAVATDPALVVALSPNSPVPTGSNTIGAVTQASGPWTENLTQIAGNAVSTAATGVQKVGIVGNAGATLDSTLVAGTAPTDGLGVLTQYNTTQPAPTNAQTLSLQSDQSGNLFEFPGIQTKIGVAWSSATAINTLQYLTGTTTEGAPSGSPAILVQLDQTTTLTGGAVTFQGTYDNINWVTVPAGQIINPQTFLPLTNPYLFVASTQQAFLIFPQGFQQIRLNLTTVITGTGTVTPYWNILPNISAVPLDNGTLTVGSAPGNGVSVLTQYNTTQPAPTNTQTVSLQSDQSGNLLDFPSVQTKAGAAWTSATAINTLQYATGTTTIGAPYGAKAIIVQLDQTTTLTGGAVTFQGTYDGTNWITLPTSQVFSPQTLTQLTNPYTFVASTNQPFLILPHGFQQIRLNLTTVITGTGSVTPNWTLLSVNPFSTNANVASGQPPVYSAAFRSITPAATATDIFTITGSATKTIRVLRINFSAIQTTGASQEILLVYRTTANTGGTSATGTNVPWDPTTAAATATTRSYTANPSALGTAAGNLQIIKYFVEEGGSGSPEDYTFDFTSSNSESGIVLRGTGDTLALNWNGAAVPAGLNMDCFMIWSES